MLKSISFDNNSNYYEQISIFQWRAYKMIILHYINKHQVTMKMKNMNQMNESKKKYDSQKLNS